MTHRSLENSIRDILSSQNSNTPVEGLDEQLQEDVEQLDEAPMSPQAKAAQKHIEDLAKKHKKSFGDMRMHVDDYPSKHDQKTRDAAKALNKHQYGGWKKGSDGKMTQEEVEQVTKPTSIVIVVASATTRYASLAVSHIVQ